MLNQSLQQRQRTLNRTLKAFKHFCKLEFSFELYAYQEEIARLCLSSLFVEPKDVYIKLSRQLGKTETVTLLLRFLIIFYYLMTGSPLMAGIASPKGEQSKTDIDRVKKSIAAMRDRWQVEDREFNAVTVRAYRFNKLQAEIFKFSLAPTTSNESKTLNLLIVEEAHLTDDQKRANELDPMLSSTGGVTWHIGVGCTRLCDFKKGCDGELPDSTRIIVPVDQGIADRRKKYKETGDLRHLEYEKTFERMLKKFGRENPEIRRNFYLADTIEEGNFISRDRLTAHARAGSVIVPMERLFVGIDWARRSDNTWLAIGNGFDVIDWLKVPHVPYAEQVEIIKEWANTDRGGWKYVDRVQAVLGDSTGGAGDAPMEMLAQHSGLPIGENSHFVFTKQSKNDLYLHFETLLFTDEGRKHTYPADHALTAEYEEQMVSLLREYNGDGEFLSVHHPATADGRDDAPDATALMHFAAKTGQIGSILFA